MLGILLLICSGCLYILDIKSLSNMIWKFIFIFGIAHRHSLHSILHTKVLNFDVVWFANFFLLFCCHVQYIIAKIYVMKLILVSTLRFFIQFEYVPFVYSIDKVQLHSFACGYPVFPLFVEIIILSPIELFWHSCQKSFDCTRKSWYLGSLFLFHWSMCLSIHQTTLLITVTLEWVLKSRDVSASNLIFFWIVLAIQNPLKFCRNFQ